MTTPVPAVVVRQAGPSGLLILLALALSAAAQVTPVTATLSGQVIDPSGAVIAGATVEARATSGSRQISTTDREGHFRFDDLAPDDYEIRVSSPWFTDFESTKVTVSPNEPQTLNAQLRIRRDAEQITVSSNAAGVELDPARNAGQIVIGGSDLDALSDDPDDLSKDLQALAGPSPGSEGPEFFIDGFTGGRMPPKSSIREIRVNQNPFSAEFDRVGFGRIEISTKPGSDKYHGQASYDFANRALTARNPYFTGPTVPNYRQIIYAGNLSGPLGRKASFFIDMDRRTIDENSLLSYTTLDAGLNPIPVSGAILTPTRRSSISPRADYALSPSNTLAVRYSWVRNTAQNQGISTQSFDLASRGYSATGTEQSVQVTDTAVLGAKAVNDSRFQFLRSRTDQHGVDTSPEISVQGAFTAGGTFPLNTIDRDRYEFQNYTTIIHSVHVVKFGARLRHDQLNEQTTTNFNGRFIFQATSGAGVQAIEIYRQNQILSAQGFSQEQIAALGFGPSEFQITTGTPIAKAGMLDASLFVQDDWRVRRTFTVSTGLRYEAQTAIPGHGDLAPRIGLAWAPLPKTVIRAGAGIFLDRFTTDLLLKAAQLNGVNQTQHIVNNPAFFPNIPPPAAILALPVSSSARAVYQVDSNLHLPHLIQMAFGIERQLPRNIALAMNYTSTRGVHTLRTRDINAPLPSSFDSQGQAIGPRPYGEAAGNIYQYEGSGTFNQKQFIVSLNAKVNRRLSLYGYYLYGRARSDTDGPGTFAANPYDLRSEYGRAAFDVRHRGFISGNITAPAGVRFAPFIFLQSGLPYNITSGRDTNGDGNPNDDRPAFAQDLSRPSVVSKPGFGVFDTAPAGLANAVLVPRNYLEGPGILLVTVRVSRSWSFGEAGRGGGNSGSDEIRGGGALGNGGLSSQATTSRGVSTARPYTLTLNVTFRNLLNNVNPALPIGNLSSPSFGKSVALSTYGPLPGAGANAAGGNRHIELQLRFTF